MTTRQNEVRRILQKLNGCLPDDAEVSKMANIAEAAEIAPGDALFPLMVALEFYRVSYEKMPDDIKEASAFMLREHAEALRAEASKIAEENNARIEDITRAVLTSVAQWLQQSTHIILVDELQKLEKAAILAVSKPVNAATLRFEEATTEAKEASKTLREAGKANLIMWVAVAAVVALFGGGFGGITVEWIRNHGGTFYLTKEQQNSLALGVATEKAWKSLPEQAKKILQDAASSN